MTGETIVAVYDTPAAAEAAVTDLRAAKVPESSISRHSQDATDQMGSGTGTGTTTGFSESQAGLGREKGLWESLFGGSSDSDTAVYDRSMSSGSSVVVVKDTPDENVESVIAILERHSPIDIDERATGYGMSSTTGGTAGMTSTGSAGMTSTGSAGMTSTGAAGMTATGLSGATNTSSLGTAGDTGKMQLAEETLAVGKRLINRGGTRIRRYVVETPIEESVTLHTERVTLERNPVTDGRPVTDASFSEKTIEMTETSEEAVVSKTARVVEEIALRKEATERTETVRDTVRKEEVEIEQLPGTAATGTGFTKTADVKTTTTGGTTTSATTGPAKPTLGTPKI